MTDFIDKKKTLHHRLALEDTNSFKKNSFKMQNPGTNIKIWVEITKKLGQSVKLFNNTYKYSTAQL